MSWTFDGGRPLYTQLVEQLKAKIVSGEYPASGSPLCGNWPPRRA